MNDTDLPPGCARLHVTDDPKTWGDKRYVAPNGNLYPAKLVAANLSGKYPLLVVVTAGGDDRWSDTFDLRGCSSGDFTRLYDAAPEPVKPREWWGVRLRGKEGWLSSPLTDRAQAAAVFIGDDIEIVRLIEAPEDKA